MVKTAQFELVAPEELLLSELVELAVVPGAEGDFGFMPGHSPFISTLRTGVITVYEGDEVRKRLFVSGGVAEITPERCTVLADEAVSIETANRRDVENRVRASQEMFDAAREDEKDDAAEALRISKALLAVLDTAGQA